MTDLDILENVKGFFGFRFVFFYRPLYDSEGKTLAVTSEWVAWVKHQARWMCHPDDADEG